MNQILVASLPATLPTLAVLVGILLNRSDVNRLDARITALEISLRSEMQTLRGEIQTLCGEMMDFKPASTPTS